MAKFKKALALVLSLAMVLTLAPIASVNSKAAAKYKISAKTTAISAGKTYNVKVTGVKKGQYVKVARTAGVTVKYNKKTIKASKKVAGTGKALTFKVTVPDKVANYKSTIKVVVYNKNGKKAKTLSTKRTVKVSEFSIASVVSTTEEAGAGYKYIRATFTKALDSLDASEVEISEKATGQIYSVEKVILATNGKSADITLVGDAMAAGTRFLSANTDYVLNIKKSGATAHLDFNIPAVAANVIVYSVDAGKKQVTLNGGIFTLNDTIAAATDYNEILGRTVTVQYDKNRVINKLTVIDETVEYGAYELVDADNNGSKDSIKNKLTKTVYPLSTQTVGDIKATTELNLDAAGTLIGGTDVAYAKITLNGNGTVRRITSITAFNEVQYVVSTKDNDIVNLKGTSFSLKDFNIIKAGKTVKAVSEIKEGDVVFMNTSKKLAEVYTEGSVSGKMSVYTDKFEVNGTRYDTKGDLVADKNVQAATNASLAKYAGSEVTVFFGRNGDVVEVVVGNATKTADSYAVITKAAKVYTQGSKALIEFTADDGTGAKDYTLDPTTLTKIVQVNGTPITAGSTVGAEKGFEVNGYNPTTFGGAIAAKATNDALANKITISGNAGGGNMEAGQLVKLTKKEDGTIVGLELAGTAVDWILEDSTTPDGTAPYVATVGDTAGSFKAGAKELQDNSATVKTLPGTTPVLLWDKTAKSVKATTYGEVDFSFTINDTTPVARNDGSVRVDADSVKAIVIDVEAAGLQIAKTVSKRAVIVGATFDQSPAKKLVDLTVAYGNKADVKYTSLANDILESSLKTGAVYTDWAAGVVVDLKETEDGKLVEVKEVTAGVDTSVDLAQTVKSTFVIETGEKLITANDTSITTTIATMNTAGTAVSGVISWSDYCTLVADGKVASAKAYKYSGVYYDVIVATLAATSSSSTVTASAVVKTNDELATAIDTFGSADTIEIAGNVSTAKAAIYSNLVIDSGYTLSLTGAITTSPAKITNNGTLNLRGSGTLTEIDNKSTGIVNVDATNDVTTLKNAGTLNVGSAATLTGTITNDKTAVIAGDIDLATLAGTSGTWTLSNANATQNGANLDHVLAATFTTAVTVNVDANATTAAADSIAANATVNVKSGTTLTLGNNLTLVTTAKLVATGATIAVGVTGKTLTVPTTATITGVVINVPAAGDTITITDGTNAATVTGHASTQDATYATATATTAGATTAKAGGTIAVTNNGTNILLAIND